jgi:hypothetical protein
VTGRVRPFGPPHRRGPFLRRGAAVRVVTGYEAGDMAKRASMARRFRALDHGPVITQALAELMRGLAPKTQEPPHES